MTAHKFTGNKLASLSPVLADVLLPVVSFYIARSEEALAAWILSCDTEADSVLPPRLILWSTNRLSDKLADPQALLEKMLALPQFPSDSLADEVSGYIAALNEAIATCVIVAHKSGNDIVEPLLVWARSLVDDTKNELPIVLFSGSTWFSPRINSDD